MNEQSALERQIVQESEDLFKQTTVFPMIGSILSRAARYKRGMHIIDYGCGTGMLAAYMPEDPHITLIDQNLEVLLHAVGKYSDAGYDPDAINADHTTFLPLLPAGTDAIVASFLLNQIEDPWIFFDHSFRYLREGGLLILALPDESFLLRASERGGGEVEPQLNGILNEGRRRFMFAGSGLKVEVYPRTNDTYFNALTDSGFQVMVQRVADPEEDPINPKAVLIVATKRGDYIDSKGVATRHREIISPSLVEVGVDPTRSHARLRLQRSETVQRRWPLRPKVTTTSEDIFVPYTPKIQEALMRMQQGEPAQLYVRLTHTIAPSERREKVRCKLYMDGKLLTTSEYLVEQ